VDALRNCHRMLNPYGLLLDLHPIPPSMHAFAGGKDLGVVDEREFFRAVRATERELRRTVDAGLFVPGAETELDVIERFDTLDELFETVEEWGDIHFSKRLRGRLQRATPPIDLRERLVLRRYRAIPLPPAGSAGRGAPYTSRPATPPADGRGTARSRSRRDRGGRSPR
jgi:hypothetical protein